MLQLKKKNSVNLFVSAVDGNGNVITNLATVSEIYFVLKNNKTDQDAVAVLAKQKTVSGITVDDPNEGTIKVELSASDMDIGAKEYYMAVQLEYPDGTKYELNLKNNDRAFDKVTIQEDIIKN